MTRPTAVVTGSSGAIGSAICHRLIDEGYAVTGIDVRPTPGDRGWTTVVVDLGRPDEVATAFRAIPGRLDLLVNNAGRYLALDFLETTPDDYSAVFDANIASAFYCSQEFARRAIAQELGGVIINVASVSGRTGSIDCAYGASKGAVIALTQSLGLALAPHGIRANAVAPGIVESEMSRRIPPDRSERYREETPLGRFCAPEEIAAVIAFLAGSSASYMTRSVVDVNGGLW